MDKKSKWNIPNYDDPVFQAQRQTAMAKKLEEQYQRTPWRKLRPIARHIRDHHADKLKTAHEREVVTQMINRQQDPPEKDQKLVCRIAYEILHGLR